MRKVFFCAVLVGASWMAAAPAVAGPMTYKEVVTTSGSLNGASFTNALTTITAVSFGAITHTSVYFVSAIGSFDIAGIGGGSFAAPIYVFNNQTTSKAGISDPSTFHDIVNTQNAAFATYDLSTPITVSGTTSFNNGFGFATDAGLLMFTSVSNSTFSATDTETVPEPSTWVLLLSALGIFSLLIRRKRSEPA
jgi:hypothetical protein